LEVKVALFYPPLLLPEDPIIFKTLISLLSFAAAEKKVALPLLIAVEAENIPPLLLSPFNGYYC